MTEQLRADEVLKEGCYGVQVPDDEEEIRRNTHSPELGYSGKYRDDLTGQLLKDELVEQARAVELLYLHSKGVWVNVPRSKARSDTGRPPISARWVDVSTGDKLPPNYRSRLVARQPTATDRSGQSDFATAPPLEAFRAVLGLAGPTSGSTPRTWIRSHRTGRS